MSKVFIWVQLNYKWGVRASVSWIWSCYSSSMLTSISLLVCSRNIEAYSFISFSRPFFAASMRTKSGTVVSKKESDTWSIIALRSWGEIKKSLFFFSGNDSFISYFYNLISYKIDLTCFYIISKLIIFKTVAYRVKTNKISKKKNHWAIALLFSKCIIFFLNYT